MFFIFLLGLFIHSMIIVPILCSWINLSLRVGYHIIFSQPSLFGGPKPFFSFFFLLFFCSICTCIGISLNFRNSVASPFVFVFTVRLSYTSCVTSSVAFSFRRHFNKRSATPPLIRPDRWICYLSSIPISLGCIKYELH